MKQALILILVLFVSLGSHAQNLNPSEDEIYREGEVAIIHITMTPADKAFMLDDANVWYDEYLPAGLQFENSLMDTVLAFNVGVRLRGNTSRDQPKRSFKIKFKEYGGEKFYGYKKFNLKAENNDPSMIRELMTMQTFRKANVPAARTHHAEVYINGEYMGLYLNVEQLDDEFALSRFNYDEGNLYKCTWPATLEDDGQIYDDGPYELKTNEDLNDRSVLANFVKVLNNTAEDDFEEAIEEVFNVESYLKYLAVEVLTGHWDGYSYNKNNYYLYENNSTGLVEFIPYDVDNTFGIDWVGRDWGTRDVLDWTKHGDPRPLSSKILARGKYFRQYKRILDSLLKGDFSEAYYFPIFNGFKSMLKEPLERDVYFPLTFGYSCTDFEDSYTQEVISHAPYGLKPYITTRTSKAREQIGVITGISAKVAARVDVYPNPTTGRTLLISSEKVIKEIELMDMMGRNKNFTVRSIDNSRYQLEFNLSSGIYVIYADGYPSRFIVK